MAYVNTFTIADVPVICTGSGTHDWISADFKIVATANASNTAYTVQIYARIDANGWMEWDGTSTLRVSCNGQTASANMQLAMYNGSEGALTQWDGPATFSLGGTWQTELNFSYITIDLTTTTGSNGLPGIWHVPDDGNMTAFTVYNYKIIIGDGGLQPLLNPPVISNLTNTNSFNSNTGVSEYTDRISLSWDSNIAVTGSTYRINGGEWKSITSSATRLILYDLIPGTSYIIELYSMNSAGSSNNLSITVRTRHLQPVVSLEYNSSSIDTIMYNWTSDKQLAYTQYRIGTTGAWVNANSSGNSGNFTVPQLEPNTKYTIFFRGTSSSTYDSLVSEEVFEITTTHNIARIINATNLIFGESILLDIDHTSNRVATLSIHVEGNSRQFDDIFNIIHGRNTITFNQNQLDSIYKCFTNTNSIIIKMTTETTGQWNTYTENKEYTLYLTGIAKTAHINVNGSNKRVQAFLGIYDLPRRAIFWVGDENNKPRRCI